MKPDMSKWVGYNFYAHTHPNTRENYIDAFESFIHDLNKWIKANLPASLVMTSRVKGNHFTCSGFVYNKDSGKYAYWSMADVRHWQDGWNTDVLVRTAAHDKDFTGGINHYSTLASLGDNLLALTL